MKIEERETWAAERVRDLFEPFGVKPFGAKKGPNETLADHVSRESYTPHLRMRRCECSRRFKRDLEKPIKSSQHESLILAQNERWRQA